MAIELRIQGKSNESEQEGDSERIVKSFQFALDRFAHAVRAIEITFGDVNGPRGGVDKICSAQIFLASGGAVVASAAGETHSHAAHLTADRAKRVLLRRLSRQKALARKRERLSPKDELLI